MREYMEDTYAEAHAEMEHGEGVTGSARSRSRGRKPGQLAVGDAIAPLIGSAPTPSQ
jgi:hypothetical protein